MATQRSITTREIKALIYALLARAAPALLDDKPEQRKARDELLLAAQVIRVLLRSHNSHETLVLDAADGVTIVRKQVLGHTFTPMDAADWDALAGAAEGSYVCYTSDLVLVLCPDGSEIAAIDADGNQVVWVADR